MKTFIYSFIVLIFLPSVLYAQTEEAGEIAKIWSYPAVYQYTEQVSWYFDLAGTTFAEDEDVYLWIWSPSEPDAGNWENSSDYAKLSYEGNSIWRFDLIPTEYFGVSAEDIAASAGFWLRLKNKDGSKQSGVASVSYTPFSDFYTAEELIQSFPEKPYIDSPLSILFNSNLIADWDQSSTVHIHSGLNDWEILQEFQAWIPEVVEKTKLKDLGNGFYKMDMIPKTYFNAPEDYVMENMTFLFVNFVNGDWGKTSGDQKLFAANVVPPPSPVFNLFPLKISQKDILGIIRVHNERGVTSLAYTITAGSKEIAGEFRGGVDEIKGFIDLATELKEISNLSKIHVLVKDNNDRTISDTDITLVNVDK
ncbi:hypothetical protein ACT3CD_03650 [Geofilum sp. OHC36d9]|uniref:hypothetical protein n=1 Tax=Geofilum sp. OHC36d9 TaxID=3458413 RepID=UPI0040343FB6